MPQNEPEVDRVAQVNAWVDQNNALPMPVVGSPWKPRHPNGDGTRPVYTVFAMANVGIAGFPVTVIFQQQGFLEFLTCPLRNWFNAMQAHTEPDEG